MFLYAVDSAGSVLEPFGGHSEWSLDQEDMYMGVTLLHVCRRVLRLADSHLSALPLSPLLCVCVYLPA